jgi:hypothetical protein
VCSYEWSRVSLVSSAAPLTALASLLVLPSQRGQSFCVWPMRRIIQCRTITSTVQGRAPRGNGTRGTMHAGALRRVVLVPDAVRVYLSRENRRRNLARSTVDSLTAVSTQHEEACSKPCLDWALSSLGPEEQRLNLQ